MCQIFQLKLVNLVKVFLYNFKISGIFNAFKYV